MFIRTCIIANYSVTEFDLQKSSQFIQKLKSNLMNNVNDTLMQHQETSSTWL